MNTKRVARRWPLVLLLGSASLLACSSDPVGAGGGPGPRDSGTGGPDDVRRPLDARPPADIGDDEAGDGTDGGSGCGLVTCASAHATCGPIGDGCGGILQCGSCTAPETCGGGQVPSACGGHAGCVPMTCAQAGASCGPAGDGCGGTLQCGTCTVAGETCGGGGRPSVCGGGPIDGGRCMPRTCADARANCGPVGDGCGGLLDCGSCTQPRETCGGTGVPNVCGSSASTCVARTCDQMHATCGPIGDGCGGTVQCGACMPPEICGGAGPNRCGGLARDAGPGCVPRTCAQAGARCGPAGDGCGGVLDCGTCTVPGETCGGAGMPSVCGSNASHCVPRTCATAGANCGPVANGCGGLIQCGGCVDPAICGGGGTPSVCGGAPDAGTCTGLCPRQVTCDGGTTTSVTGTVYAPTPPQFGVPDPLYNALVYVPNAPVAPFTPGVACERCGTRASGSPLVSANSTFDGRFTLTNVPTGPNIPLVIQLGRWRRQVTIPNVAACRETQLPMELTRLPRNKREGDIPQMAMVTGRVDTLECVLRKIGIEDTEFTVPSAGGGDGRVQFYIANGSNVSGGAPNESALWSSAATLANYDLVLFACEGQPIPEQRADQDRVIDYTRLGGRVFATHYSYVWLYDAPPFSMTAGWNPDQTFPTDPLTGIIDQSFPKGIAFAQWLSRVGASATPGQIQIGSPRHDLDSVVAPAQRWIYSDPPEATIQHYTFNTPVGSPADQQCGRVLFSDFHVTNITDSSGFVYPGECTAGPMTAQEKVLEFMLFDLASCIQPDVPPPPMCRPRTCVDARASCGPIGDGCGGMLNCGECVPPQTCGGGGMPSMCGGQACMPRTCMDQGIRCGPAGDGCGRRLECGTCPSNQTCGGGGVPGVCGAPPDAGRCTPITCADQRISCGPAGNGCGGALDCGLCTVPGETCGGGGMPGVCGSRMCTPRTCADQMLSCGPSGDGCGHLLNCGACTPPETCGGGGVAGTCGAPPDSGLCVPRTCEAQGFNCGPAGDGCGHLLDCGTCTSPLTCGGGGTGGVCGRPNCVPRTCAEAHAECGAIADGCGSTVDCGECRFPRVCGGGGVPHVCAHRF